MKPSEILVALGTPKVDDWLAHPTVSGLAAGTLALDRFEWWARQNYCYLQNYVRVYAKLAVVAPSGEMELYVAAAHNLANIELGLYRDLAVELGVDVTAPVTPTALNLAYQKFLLSNADEYGVGLAAALPCLWAFTTMGSRMPIPGEATDHPYALWLRTYQGEALRAKVATLLGLLDAAEPDPVRVASVVAAALELETAFWTVPHEDPPPAAR